MSRELDIEVAKLLGYHVIQYPGTDVDTGKVALYWMLADPDGDIVEDAQGEPWENVPRFSTDIAAALTVIEALPATWSVTIIRQMFGSDMHYLAGIDLVNDDGYIVQSLGQTRHRSLPEAICRAVLEAKRIS